MPKPPKKFEGSPKDKREDKSRAKRMGMSMKSYEKSSADAKHDRAGQKGMKKK